MIAFVFPGQGAQAVGMGADLYEARDEARRVFDAADEALGFELSRLCFEGPAEELTETQNAQPAILACSVACLRAVEAHGIHADVAAGHSLGEYTALVCAGALSLEQAVRLVRRRGELMAQARAGAMAAILGLGAEAVTAVCEQAGAQGVLVPANFNDPGQVVVSGEPAAVTAACELAKQAGARRTVPLPVSGAFHSPLMNEAGERMAEELSRAEIGDPAIPVIANVDAEPKTAATGVRAALAAQVTSSVRWQQSIERIIAGGGEAFAELGPGRALSGMIRRISPEAETHNVSDLTSLAATVAALAG